MPKRFNPQNLQELNLFNNQLTSLPESFNPRNLAKLSLSNNQLTSLPESFNPQNLRKLDLERNQNLRELPMSLANCPELIHIEIEGTQVSPEIVRQILQTCQANRNLQVEERLPNLLNLWSSYAQGDRTALRFLLELEVDDRQVIANWLNRLTQTRDFRGYQKELAKTVYEMLVDFSQEDLRTTLLAQIRTNNEACEDRAAMALNELYLAWKIWRIQKQEVPEETRREFFELLGGAGRTLSLRKILSQMPQMATQNESVEIYLYYETALRDRLQLLTAIRRTAYAEAIGEKSWINKEELVQKVLEQYLDEVIALPAFDQLFNKDKEIQEQVKSRQEADGEILEQLTEASEKNELTEDDYIQSADDLQQNQKIWIQELKKKWFCKQVK